MLQRSQFDPAGFVAAFFLVALAALVFWDMSTLEISQTYGVGPKAMPIVVGTGLLLLAAGNVAMGLRKAFPEREPALLLPVVLILGGLGAVMALIYFGGGFIPAMAILFTATAAAFGRRAILTDLAIGVAIAAVTYLIFAKLLMLSLPMGPLERLV